MDEEEEKDSGDSGDGDDDQASSFITASQIRSSPVIVSGCR